MKKMLLVAVALPLALSFAPAQAAPGTGCNAAGVADGAAIVCTYVSTGAATSYIAATPNHYRIDRTYVDSTGMTRTQNLVNEESLSFPTQGTLSGIAAGDTITVTMGPDDAEGFVNGSIGIVAAYETA